MTMTIHPLTGILPLYKGGRTMPRPAVTAVNFWDRVKKGSDDECWPWTGPVSRSSNSSDPYGRIDIFGFKGVYVHRVAYWCANGGVLSLRKDGDLLVRHSCDNSICCNPKHLLLGTHADNMRDKMERGRQTRFTGPGSPRAKLTAADVRAIRELSAAGLTRKALASQYGVSLQTIKAVRSGRHYADVA